jgi:hypothetical protein
MKNIFNKQIIEYFSNKIYMIKDISEDLYIYLFDNLFDENYKILSRDLQNALTNNANGKYI